AALNTGLLTYALRHKLKQLAWTGFVRSLLVLVPAAILTSVLAWYGHSLWEAHVGHQSLAARIGAVFVPGGIAALVYWLVALWGQVPAAKEMGSLFLRRFRKRKP
ncbi:MAG TPA: murein biosynthesis integral membrane protein MurJ, partial [Clostridia bacterium]|nr:murein biosynthesis integral membrane protein MurJ [Clostridia bacterium]